MASSNPNPTNPLSFKTVPGRHRTQKWNTAPKNTYDGDDWGDYDPYDDYGDPEAATPPPLPSQSSALPSQRLRKQSFDRGDDGMRSVSAPFPAYQQAPLTAPGSSDFPSRPRDFTNPDQQPPPLRPSASREAAVAPPGFFPPRKSSMGGNTYDAQQEAAEARAIAESITHPAVNVGADKPLPFIRPSDIYKRMEDEKRRESEESARPSIDALERVTSAERKADLEPVQEQREQREQQEQRQGILYPSTYQPQVRERSGNEQQLQQLPVDSTLPRPRGASPTLPLVSRFSGFGDEILTLTSPKSDNDAPVPSKHAPPSVNTAGLATPSSSIQPTPTSTTAPTRAAPGSDPAAEILAERQQADGLQHQQSVGFRSAVHQAFDQNDASLSRDNSGSTPSAGVERSDTSSTAGISPIMSRVPSAATAALTQRERDERVPPIIEESSTTPTTSRPGSGVVGVARKPSPGRSKNTTSDHAPASFEPGYRRSLDPPSSGTSPARTPALETVEARRLSTPLSGVIGADDPDVVDQGAEIVQPDLHPAETPASEVAPLHSTSAVSPAIPITGRGRSNTDYSVREADLANTINSSPDKDPNSPILADAARESKDSRDLFLRTHNMPGTSPARASDPTRSPSPAKSRVREIAEKYHQIHDDSRRNSAASIGSSKSGWSTYTDDAKQPKLKRATTGQSQLGQETELTAGSAGLRPELGREESFKPDLPGGWINSEAPTPAVEAPPQIATVSSPEEPVDLSPTTKKYQLQGAQPTSTTRSPIDAARDVGSQLGAALMGQYGVAHQTRDFASKDAPASAEPPEALQKRAYGDVPMAPPLLRYETDSTDAPTSVASSAAPTPLPKDTPKGEAPASGLSAGYFNTVAPLRVRSREASPEHGNTQQPGSSQHLSQVSGDSAEDDRIREEIVRSLDSTANDTARAQDALNVPDNERSVEHGGSVYPVVAGTAAVGLGAVATFAASNAKSTPTKPSLLNTRFSWENSTALREEPQSPEIKPEAAYERPRSKQLHIMNPSDVAISPDTPARDQLPELSGTVGGPLSVPDIQRPEAAAAEGEIVRSLSQRVKSPVSPVVMSSEHVIPETTIGPGSPSQSLRDVAPSPISDRSPRAPSYYADSPQDTAHAPSSATATSPTRPKSSGQSHGQIPAFRNILQIKDVDDRIKTYDDTRRTFADMNTGLGDWLQAMTARHPDVLETTEMGKPPLLEPSVSATGTNQWKRGHRAAAPSMNLTGLKNRFASGSTTQVDGQGRTASSGAAGPSNLASSDTAGASGGVDLDRVQQQMQQKGKELMKNAGVFGSKASTGAKGLLAKGRSRFGGSVRGKGGEVRPSMPAGRTSSSAFSKLRSLSTSSSIPKPGAKSSAMPNRDSSITAAAPEDPQVASSMLGQDVLAGAERDAGVVADSAAEKETVDRSLERDHTAQVEQGKGNDASRTADEGVLPAPSLNDYALAQDDSGNQRAVAGGQHASPTVAPTQAALTASQLPVPTSAAVTALAAHISDAETKSEAVQELKEAAPIFEQVALQSSAEDEGRAGLHTGPRKLTESTHIPSTSLPTVETGPSPVMSKTKPISQVQPNVSPFDAVPTPDSFPDAPAIVLGSTNLAPSTASAFENRPDLSRRTSASSSVPAFKRREGSSTPSSGSGRPQSGVFDRLREKTRSWSRTRKEGSRSRPASLILSQSNLLSDEGLQTPGNASAKAVRGIDANQNDEEVTPKGRPQISTSDFALTDFSDVAVDPSKTVLPDSPGPAPGPQLSPQRTEAWNEPDAQLPPKSPNSRTQSSSNGRLGVLPSPAPTATTFADGERHASIERSRRRSSAVVRDAWRLNLDEQYGKLIGEPLDVVPSQVPSEESAIVPPTAVGAKAPEQESVVAHRPQQQRKVSDIAMLPSQQRRASESAGRPISYPSSPQDAVNMGSGLAFGNGALPPLVTGARSGTFISRHGRNESEISGLTDAEFVEASPVTMQAAEPTLVHGSNDAAGTRNSSWDKEIAEQEAEIKRLGSLRMAHQKDEPAIVPNQTSDRGAGAGAPFASIIASATARKEKQIQRLVDTQPNPYVLSDHSRKTSAATANMDGPPDKWEDARSEVSAEDGALGNSVHQSTDLPESRRSSVSSIGNNAIGATAGHSPTVERDMPASFDTVRAPPEQQQPLIIEKPMTSQAVPAGPSGASPVAQQSQKPEHARNVSQGLLPGMRPPNLGGSDFQKRFSQRLYAQRPVMGDRPLSYMTLPRDEGGFVRESIDTGAEASPAPYAAQEDTIPTADISALGGPPAGTPPFQQHPVFRNSVADVQPTEYERMRSSSRLGGVLTSPGLTEGPTSSSGEGGYFRDPQPFSTGLPGRNVISDNHGLEDVHAWGEAVATPRDEVPPTEIKQARRKSGMWNAFTNRRTSTGVKLDIVEPIAPLASLENSDTVGATATSGEPERYDTTKKGAKKTLQKPQRASSSAVKLAESEPKKKRFSGFKSFLGRSSTTAGESNGIRSSSQTREDKSRKLQKNAPIAPIPAPQYQRGNPATVKGGIHSYEEYERARKREMAAFAEQSGGPPVSRVPDLAEAVDQERTPTGQPPADGWYGPSSRSAHRQDEIGVAHTTGQAPEDVYLPNQSPLQVRPMDRVPEAFRPVDAPYSRSIPGNPPPMRGFGSSEQQQQQQYGPSRQGRHGSDSSVPISGRSDYFPGGQRGFGSMSAISPVQTPGSRIVSVGTEMARSPAKDYADQQTPFAIGLPAGSRPGSRDFGPGAAEDQQYQYAETSPPRMQSPQYHQNQQQIQSQARAYDEFNDYDGQDYPSEQQRTYGNGNGRGGYPLPPYVPAQQSLANDWMSRQGQQYSHPSQAPMYQSRAEAGAMQQQHVPQQQQQQQGWYPRQRSRDAANPSPPIIGGQQQQHRRYYSHQGPSPPLQQQPGRPPPGSMQRMQQQQRLFIRGEAGGVDYYNTNNNNRMRRPGSSSGYSGRRDDPAVGEDEVDLIMRGASYPGQEWDPYSGRR